MPGSFNVPAFFFCPGLLLLLGSAPNSFVSPRIYSLCFSGKHSTDCKNTFNLVPNCIFNKLCLHPLPPPAFLQNSGFSESPETCNPHQSWSSKQLMLRLSVMSDSFDPMDCRLPASSVHGILHAKILEWVAISTSWSGLPFLLQGKSGIAESYDCSMFNFWRNPQAVFLGGCTILRSEGQEFELVQLGNAAPCHIS